MAKYIEGDWKGFEFRMIDLSSDIPRVLNHLHKTFFHSTPLTQGLTYSKEYFDEFDKIYIETIPQGMSFYVLDKSTNEIAGLRITFIQTVELEEKFEKFNFQTPQMKIMNEIMGTVNKEANLYKRYGIDSFVNFYTACVDAKYQGQGIATEMYERALAALRANKKYAYVKSNLASPWTRRICHKYKFKELARAYYNDFRNENGFPLLIGRADDEFVSYMCLKLV